MLNEIKIIITPKLALLRTDHHQSKRKIQRANFTGP